MLRLPLATALMTLLASSSLVSAQETTLVVERSAVEIPSWETAVQETDVEDLATRDEYAAAAADGRYLLETLCYRSDGLDVVAYLYRLRGTVSTPRPVVVFNRGSYVRGAIAPELLPMFHRLAEAGFVTVAPMYRGSAGAGGTDEMGGTDLDDLMRVADLLGELDSADTANVFLYGESRGGMMVFQAIRDGFPARAAATWGAFTDLDELVSTTEGLAMARAIWPDFDRRREQIVARRSALRWPERLTIPLLLMHGAADTSVAPGQTLRLAMALTPTHPDLGVVLFPGGRHVLADHRDERDRHAIAFFREHMADAPAP